MIEAIEKERMRLMQAEALLDCVLVAMEDDAREPTEPHYPGVIELARDILHETLEKLDSANLKPLIREMLDTKMPR